MSYGTTPTNGFDVALLHMIALLYYEKNSVDLIFLVRYFGSCVVLVKGITFQQDFKY